MRKEDELALWKALRSGYQGAHKGIPVWPDFAQPLGICEKRCYSLLHKWSGNDWWDYGVNARWGWFTENAPWELNP